MGRHASSPEPGPASTPHRRHGLHVVVLVVLLGAAGYGVFAVSGVSATGDRSAPPSPNGTHTRSAPSGPQTLVIKVTGPECDVQVRQTGAEAPLLNDTLAKGRTVRFDQPRLSVHLSDPAAVQVYVNGELRRPQEQSTFTVTKS
ncbi:hypothetical protein J4573_03695 [Actinomadura barringtoniae]|uniref:Cytoskeleton protein RodZ-like C-terminal domain-containing protein n=1 Tax=Actinomadura barringtoniae TaxID=1427535 RepID=A0A939PBD5_9ACTN|nr:RodZ domain-containing protein [Actinomadura barringtoniae]MBO2446179.1 hypothetical protein [Actinomadura barringtoniae]